MELVNRRAPNCPAISLPDAIEKTELIFNAEGRSSFDGEIAVHHMQYKGLNGASRRALGALRSFGLIEGRVDELRISRDAITVIADAQTEDQQERQAALFRCLARNRVFADLFGQFGTGSSLLNIAAYLQKRYGFKPHAARKTAKVFRQSVSLVAQGSIQPGADSGVRYNPARASESAPAGGSPQGAQDATAFIPAPAPSAPLAAGGAEGAAGSGQLPGTAPGAVQAGAPGPRQLNLLMEGGRDTFTLGSGTVVLTWPADMTAEDFEDFTDWLLVEHRKIARQLEPQDRVRLVKTER